jgi:hypothetical protein
MRQVEKKNRIRGGGNEKKLEEKQGNTKAKKIRCAASKSEAR